MAARYGAFYFALPSPPAPAILALPRFVAASRLNGRNAIKTRRATQRAMSFLSVRSYCFALSIDYGLMTERASIIAGYALVSRNVAS
jgi:hypothetical protein